MSEKEGKRSIPRMVSNVLSGDARLGDALNNKKRAQSLRTGRVNGIGRSHLSEAK